MARLGASRRVDTGLMLLDAARAVLRRSGYAGLSTRDVAAVAGVPLSQIHYHFGSKQGMVLALFEHMNAQLLDRQNAMFSDPTLTLAQQWDIACDYLEEDIASGYVRVAQEIIAAAWSDPAIAGAVRTAMMGWIDLLTAVAVRAERENGALGPVSPREFASLAANLFIGAESLHLLGVEADGAPVRDALRRVGDLLRLAERPSGKA